MKTKREKKNNPTGVVYHGVQLVVMGSITGIFSGLVVTLYTICASFAEKTSISVYEFIRQNPLFIPLLFIALALGSFILSVAIKLVPMIKGSGIPQTEGATRGSVHFKWYRDTVMMFAVSLASIFMGLSAGAEGPSVFIGSTVGDGVAKITRRKELIRRYQITGGACAGLAIAVGAPMSGIAFAFEEAHKRFTSEVFICAFSSVIVGLLTKYGVYNLLGLEMHNGFHSFNLVEIPYNEYLYVLVSAVICGLLGVILFKSVFWIKSLFSTIELKNGILTDWVKIAIAVAIGGLFSLITVNLIGGGHDFIDTLGSLATKKTPSVFGLSILGTLFIVLILRSIAVVINMGSGVPCGTFIPMLAIGACMGALLSEVCIKLGMSIESKDALIMICMATFFATIVKAPITAVIMVLELSWSFTPLLPVIIGVSIGYFIGDVARTDSIYEVLLENFIEERRAKTPAKSFNYQISVSENALAIGREIRDILWPDGVRVTEILRGEEIISPDGGTIISVGDRVTLSCFATNVERTKEEINGILT